jgi:hypothetical protein
MLGLIEQDSAEYNVQMLCLQVYKNVVSKYIKMLGLQVYKNVGSPSI